MSSGDTTRDPWKRRRRGYWAVGIAFAVITVAQAALGQGSWIVAVVGVVVLVFIGVGMRRSKREWARPRVETAAASTKSVGSAQVVVERAAEGYADRMRAYRVFMDGRVVGELLPGERTSIAVAPGDHVVQLRIDWARSRAITVNPAEGQVARFAARPRAAWAAVFWVTLGVRRYPNLQLVDAPAAASA